jgi:uncharacterized membrane protein YedE/YeeE
MNFDALVDRFGEPSLLAAGGLVVGLAFGSLAQHSKFCLRSAVIEFSGGSLSTKVAIWLLTFSAAVAATQAAIVWGLLDVTDARQLAARGSLSGAVIGGLMFGAGMILARGCAARLLVLSATGNLRALVAGLILTVTAQASFRGILSPVRETLAELWTVNGGASRYLLSLIHAGPAFGLALGASWLAFALWLARRARIAIGIGASAIGVGLSVAAGWLFTFTVAQHSFALITINSVTFNNSPTVPLGFGIALVPGVFAGSLFSALIANEWKLEGFHDGQSMTRYLVGAILMGFGGMLAGGCAVGAGVTGSAIFALTGWVALSAMWAGGVVTHFIIDGRLFNTLATMRA